MIKNHHKNCKFMINFKFLWPRLESITIGNQLDNKFSIFRPKIMKLILFINLSLILNINFKFLCDSFIKLARTKQWTLRVTLKGCCIMRACDDEQESSSPVRHECNEQGRSARAQGSSPALCRVPRAMNEWTWARGEPRQSRVGSKRAAPQRALPRTSARSLARSERKLACH